MTGCTKNKLILMVNLGSVEELSVGGIRSFLREFLSDRRVVDMPRLLWLPILHGVVLTLRPRKLVHQYSCVWKSDPGAGVPDSDAAGKESNGVSLLTWHSAKLADAVSAQLAASHPCAKVALAMTYGSNSIHRVLENMHATDKPIDSVVVLPLFPQYSSSTSASVFDRVSQYYARHTCKYVPSVHFIRDYAEHPSYIGSLVDSVLRALSSHYCHSSDVSAASLQSELDETRLKETAILVSYHGIPVQLAADGDDYPERCEATTRALRQSLEEKLGLALSDVVVHVYQSKFGPAKWLTPSLTSAVTALPQEPLGEKARLRKEEFAQEAKMPALTMKRAKTCFVVTPGFAADCIETVHEVDVEARDDFLAHGGRDFVYIDCLNSSQAHAKAIVSIIESSVVL